MGSALSPRNNFGFWLYGIVGGGIPYLFYVASLESGLSGTMTDLVFVYSSIFITAFVWSALLSIKQMNAFYSRNPESGHIVVNGSTLSPIFAFMILMPVIFFGLILAPAATGILVALSALALTYWRVQRTFVLSGNKSIRESETFFYVAMMSLIAVYVPIQVWFNAALINTVGSDENLIYNSKIADYSLLFAAAGITIHLVRAVGKSKKNGLSVTDWITMPLQMPFRLVRNILEKPIRGKRLLTSSQHFGPVAIAFFMIFGTFGMYHGIQGAVSVWASFQSPASKSAALIGMLGRTAMMHEIGIPGESDEFKSPERVRLEMMYMPAALSLSGSEGLDEMRNAVRNSDYVRGAFQASHVVPVTSAGFESAKSDLTRAWNSYSKYMQLVGININSEGAARQLIESRIRGQDRTGKSYYLAKTNSNAGLARGYRETNSERIVRRQGGYTCSAKADFIMQAVVIQANGQVKNRKFTMNDMGLLLSRGGVGKLREVLESNGVWLSSNWKYQSNAQMRRDLAKYICEAGQRAKAKFVDATGISVPSNPNSGNVLTLAQYMQKLTGTRITDVDGFTYEKYQDMIENRLTNMTTETLLQEAQNRVSAYGSDWVRAAVMPVVGVTTSLLVMIFNVGFLLYKGSVMAVRAYVPQGRWNQVKAKVSYGVGAGVLVLLGSVVLFASQVHTAGLAQGFLNVQEVVYRAGNFQLTRHGFTPSMSDQSDAYKKRMADHHLSKAQNALVQNRLTTPPSRSALYHVMMAKYHWPEVDTGSVLESVIQRYKALGADDPSSSLHERFRYIQDWNEIYL